MHASNAQKQNFLSLEKVSFVGMQKFTVVRQMKD